MIKNIEDYLNFLLNTSMMAVKKDIPLETCYSIIYTKPRQNEREASSLAGFDVLYFNL